MAKVKISDLDAAATLDGTELVELEQDGASVQCTTQDIADLGGGGASYLKYVALLTQTGTDAPVATVLENTLGGTVVWSYDDSGEYIATLAGVFTENKTAVFCGNTAAAFLSGYWDTVNTVKLDVSADDGTLIDDGLALTPIEIRVYP